MADGQNIRGDICFGEVGTVANGGTRGQPASGARGSFIAFVAKKGRELCYRGCFEGKFPTGCGRALAAKIS